MIEYQSLLSTLKTPVLLIFGKPERKEFRLWWETLDEPIRQRAQFVENLDSWLRKYEKKNALSPEYHPDFVVLLRSFPGDITEEQVCVLRKILPITPILSVVGNWCEGEVRNGFQLKQAHTLLWYDFASMSPLEWFAFALGQATVWALPTSALLEHRMLFELKREAYWKQAQVPFFDLISSEKTWNFQIESDDFDQYILLRDFCQRALKQASVEVFSRWNGREAKSAPDFLFFDFPDFTDATVQMFYSLKNRFPDAILVAFTEFPRPDEWNFLKRSGVEAVFPKPFRMADLTFFCHLHMKQNTKTELQEMMTENDITEK